MNEARTVMLVTGQLTVSGEVLREIKDAACYSLSIYAR